LILLRPPKKTSEIFENRNAGHPINTLYFGLFQKTKDISMRQEKDYVVNMVGMCQKEFFAGNRSLSLLSAQRIPRATPWR